MLEGWGAQTSRLVKRRDPRVVAGRSEASPSDCRVPRFARDGRTRVATAPRAAGDPDALAERIACPARYPERLSMNRKIRIIRNIVLALLVGFLLLIGLCYTSTARRGREPEEAIKTETRANDRTQLVAEMFEDVQTIAGRVVSRIRAKRTIGFKSGWYVLEDVQLTIYREDGKTWELFCPRAEFKPDTKEALVQGGVRVTSSDGVEISTDEMKFDGNQLTNKIPVNFKVDAWTGRAGGVDLNLQLETLRLTDGVTAEMKPPAPEPAMSLTAGEAIVLRKTNELSFHNGVQMQRTFDTLRSLAMTVRSDASHRAASSIVGSGSVLLQLTHGSPLLASGTAGPGAAVTGVLLRSDSFFAEFGANNALSAILMVSESLSHATLDGPPRRDIDAKQFRAVFKDGAAAAVYAEQNVLMRETGGESPRVITATGAAIYLDPKTHKPSSSTVEGNVRYDDGKSHGQAERANFDIASDRLFLTAVPGVQPTLTSDGQILKANVIEMNPKEKMLKATGAVVTQLVSKKGSANASGTTLFPGGSTPVFVNADGMLVRQLDQVAYFAGNVRAWQDLNTLFAAELRVEGNGDVVFAKGGVRALLYNARDKAKPTPFQARSEMLTAKKKESRIDLEGNVRVDDESKTLTGQKIALLFGSDKKLDRAEGSGSITVVEKASKRQGSGDSFVYRAKQQMLHLSGSPAVMSDPRGTVKGQQVVFDIGRNKVEVSGPGQTETTYNPR